MWLLFNFAGIASFVVSILWVILENKNSPKGQASAESFSLLSKFAAAILCALVPIINGAIFYYGLRSKWPSKAKFANLASLIIFFVEVGLVFYMSKMPLWGYVHP